jgi:hypothetical protein
MDVTVANSLSSMTGVPLDVLGWGVLSQTTETA